MSHFGASAAVTGVVDGGAAGGRGGIPSTLEGAGHIVWGSVEGSLASSTSNPHSHNDFGALMPKKLSRMLLDDDILLQSGSSSGTHELIHEMTEMTLSSVHASPEKPPAADLREDEDVDSEEVQRHLQEGKAGYDNECLKQVPLDEHGLPTSIGSIGHKSGKVCQICPFFPTARGCPNKIYCNLCHFSHPKQKRKKDGKSKRNFYRKTCEEMMGHIEAAPDTFIVDSEALPKFIADDARLKSKLLTRLRSHQEEQLKKKLVSL